MDINFDKIANKFSHNIYQTSKGRLRLDLLKADLSQFMASGVKPLKILDAGCGNGEIALWLAQQGHSVDAVDLSSSLIQSAQKKAAEQSIKVNWHIMSIQAFCQQASQQYDWVICHAVLEWLEEPRRVVQGLLQLCGESGHMSLMFFNHTAKLFGNLLYGNFDYIDAGMQAKKQVSLNPKNALRPDDVYLWLQQSSKLIHKRGIRSFHDYIYDRRMWQTHYPQILQKELTYSAQEPFISLGKYIHVIAQKS